MPDRCSFTVIPHVIYSFFPHYSVDGKQCSPLSESQKHLLNNDLHDDHTSGVAGKRAGGESLECVLKD